MAKIHAKDSLYATLRYYVDFMFKSAYRRVEYCGKEHIPKDGAIIYAANHTNTLMDALAVLAIDKKEKVFVSRADIFKRPLILKFLTFLKMLPINRIRDGKASLAQNEEINNRVVDALQNRVPFCIMPEATHRTRHTLMPLRKGIFRIALQANDSFGTQMPVYIVPIGIEFGHFFRYRSSLLVQIGAPINVTQFVAQHSDLTLPEQMTGLRNELTVRIKELILNVPDEANYDAAFALAQLNKREHSLQKRFREAKKTIQDTKSNELLDKAANFSRQRHERGIGMASVLQPRIGWTIMGRKILLLPGLPLFVVAAITTAPITIVSAWLCTRFKDPAFHNSVRYLTALALTPLLVLFWGILLGWLCSWIWGLAAALLFLPSFVFLHEYVRGFRLLISDLKWWRNRNLYKQYRQLKNYQL
ncbi:MAG: 1-acyl-sn-glycerol-3-phosphate acyltransferase [Bacteroidetes bacterium]|nr:1-acyl-sn-glycerol-3-phosphate acyltransferase [Bacteroidota bacterium]